MQFDATPQGYPLDAVTGLSTNPAAAYNDLAAIIRFNNAGLIDVRNGNGYQALSQVSYSANTTYHFVMTVNIPQHIYSVTVAPQGGTATTLATNYAFRSSQATAATLSYLNTRDAPGPHKVCNTAVSSAPSAPATPVVPAVPASNDVSWFEDAVPAGARTGGRGEGWSWVSSNPAPFSGTLAHQSAIAVGWSYHYFYNPTPSQQVAVGDTLYTYVYLDPANPPTSIAIGWRTGRSWEQRAYWGVPAPWGTQGTVSMRNMGALPATGQWVRLEVPASLVGLEGRSVDGMVFAELDGRATWDQTGKFQAASAPTFTISGTMTKNAAALSGVSFSGGNGASCTTSDGSGNYSCTVTQGWFGTITPSLSGHTFTPASRSYTNITVSQAVQDYSASVSTDVVWFEDGVPGGARTGGRGEGWSWVTANPTPFSGRLAHQSAIAVGWSYHYFYNSAPPRQVAVGDVLYTYVYLDPANPPTSIAIGWRTGRSWEQRAYWGVPAPWGTQGTISMRNMGTLPATGGWVRLEIPASLVGLEGRSVDGMVFAELDGRATWDQTGKF